MILKQIQIKRFKTYKDFNQIESFSKSINILIGKNGEGKSNFLNAIAYVLTDFYSHLKDESKKFLFHKETRELIEGGGHENEKNDLSKLIVELYFDNTSRNLFINKDTVCISKSFSYISKKEEFQINGKPVLKQEIFKIFANYNIKRPYFMVQQGQITNITSSTSEELFQIVIDSLGVKEFENGIKIWTEDIEKIKEFIKKLKENSKELNILIANFKRQCSDLNDYENIEKYKKSLEYVILNQKLKIEKLFLDDINSKKEEKIKEYNDSLLIQKKEKEVISMLTNKKIHFEKKLIVINNNIRKCNEEIYFINKAQEKYEINNNNANISNYNQLVKEKEKIEKEIFENNETIDIYNKKLSDEYNKFIIINKELEDIKKDCEIDIFKVNIINKIKKEGINKENIIKILNDEILQQQKYLNENKNFKDKMNESLVNNNITENENEISSKLNIISANDISLRNEITNIKNERINLANEKKNLNLEISDITFKIKTSKDSINLIIDSLLYSDLYFSVKNILNQKFKGVFGYLIDFLIVDDKFYKSIELIGKKKLFSIICDNDKTAKDVIEYNKKNKNNEIFIISLSEEYYDDQIIPQNSINDKNIIPILNFIKLNENLLKILGIDKIKFQKIIYKIFGNTLLVKNIEVGEKYSKNNFNCITSDNIIIKSGGFSIKVFSDTNQKELFTNYQKIQKEEEILNINLEKKSLMEFKIKEIIDIDNHKKEKIQTLLILIKDNHENRHSLEVQLNKIKKESKNQNQTINSDYKKIILNSENSIFKLSLLKIQFLEDMKNKSSSNIDQSFYNINFCEIDNKQYDLENKKVKLLNVINEIENKIKKELYPKDEKYKNEILKITNLINDFDFNNILSHDQKNKNENLALIKFDSLDNLNNDENQIIEIKEKYNQEKEQILEDIESLNKNLENLKIHQNEITFNIDQKETEINNIKRKIEESFKNLDNLNSSLNSIKSTLSEIDIEKNVFVEQNEAKRLSSNRELNTFEYFSKYLDPFYKKLNTLKEKMKNEFYNIDRLASEKLSQFNDKIDKFNQYLMDLEEKELQLSQLILNIKLNYTEKIKNMFNKVEENFDYYFKYLVPNGDTKITVSYNSLNKINKKTKINEIDKNKIEIEVKFDQQQQMKILKELSGGQKTLAALAFIFALNVNNLAPFYILDEVDSSLDVSSRINLGNLIKELSSHSQFFISTFKLEPINICDDKDSIYLINYVNKSSYLSKISKEYANGFLTKIKEN